MKLGKKLLADLLKLEKTEEIDSVLEEFLDYREIKIPKRNGGCRILFVPSDPLKKLQKRILNYFLYRIPVFPLCVGFRKKLSYVSNPRFHINALSGRVKTVFRLDLKDAFPSVSSNYLKNCLKDIFLEEIKKYPKGRNEESLFPIRRVKWFRELLRVEKEIESLAGESLKIIEKFADLLVLLTTFEEKLPQGAPTSPYLLNIVITKSKIGERICKIMKDEFVDGEWALSIYADDITVSTSRDFILWETRKKIIEAVESSGIFKVNYEKTSYQKSKSIAPMITGLRITKINGETKVILPKNKIRMIRGLVHRARLNPDDVKLQFQAKGYLAMLKPIYGEKIPKQILNLF